MPNKVIPQSQLALHKCRANRVVAYDRIVKLIRSVSVFHLNNLEEDIIPKQRCSIFHVATAHVDDKNYGTIKGQHVVVVKKPTINDENDARIRNVAEFFGINLRGTGIQVILLTDDSECQKIANNSIDNNSNYKAYSVRGWVQQLE
jgi:hypothetical protein